MKENNKSYFGDLILLSVAIIWGFGFIAVKVGLNSGTGAFTLMFLRFTIAAICLLPFQLRKIKTISWSTWKGGSVLGFLLFMGFAFQTIGLSYTTTSKNAFLTGVNVIIVPFLSWALTKKRVDGYSLSAAFMSLIGMGFLTLNGSLSINVGDLLTIICAVMFAGHITATAMISKKEAADTLVWIQMIVGAICSLLAMLIIKEPWKMNLSSGFAILYLGLFSTMLAFFLQTIGQRKSHATKAAILLSTESLFGSLLAFFIFKDHFSLQMIIGCILIFAAILISETKPSFFRKRNLLSKAGFNGIITTADTKSTPGHEGTMHT